MHKGNYKGTMTGTASGLRRGQLTGNLPGLRNNDVKRRGRPFTDPNSADCDFWLAYNGVRTSTLDNLGYLIDTLKTRDRNGYVTTPESGGSLFKKISFNREALWFNTLGAVRITGPGAAIVPAFNKFHNGTPWTMYLSFKYFSQAQSTTGRNIISTSGSTITNTQIGFRIDNLNSAADPHTIRIKIFNGGGGTPGVYDVQGPDNCLVDGGYNEIKIVFTGTVLMAFIRNATFTTFTSIGTDSTGSGLVTTNSTTTMAIGVEGFGFKGYLKHIVAWNRVLTAKETADMDRWIGIETRQVIIPGVGLTYLDWGQSNDDPGSGTDNSTLSTDVPELVGLQGGYVYRALNSAYTNKQNYWNQVEPSKMVSDTNRNNWVLRRTHEFAEAGHTIYSIGAGRGSTGLLDKVASVDWYADGGSATTGDMYPNWETIVTDGLEEMEHVLRVIPVIRGITQFQGENDTADVLAVSPAYRLALENWIKSAITFLNGLGYSTTNMHYCLFRTINSGVNGPDVRADQAYVMANFKTDFPAFDIEGLSLIDTDGFDYDANHVTNIGQSEAGEAEAAILIPLI